jgi:glucose-1-phosphate thymidylyltransferase
MSDRRNHLDARLTTAQRSAAAAGLKSLIPMGSGAGRPFLDYVLSGLADAGIRDVGLVVAPEHDAIQRCYEGRHAPTRVTLSFIVQEHANGTADAVRSSEAFVAGRPFLAINADNLYPVEALRAVSALDGPGLAAFEKDDLVRTSGLAAEKVQAFAIVSEREGWLEDLVEKPGRGRLSRAGPHALVSMNCWRFDTRIFRACREVEPSPRGELEITDAVRIAIRHGVRFQIVKTSGPVLDLTTASDVPFVDGALAGRQVRP